MDSESCIRNDEALCIGPSCSKTYWDCGPEEGRYYEYRRLTDLIVRRKDAASFVDSLVNAGLSRLPPSDGYDRRARRKHQSTVADHRKLLHSTREVLHDLLKDPRVRDNTSHVLVHPDLHMSNIFVDPNNPTKVTSIIDWQSASIEPVFMSPLPILDFAPPADYLAHIERTQKNREMTTPEIWDAALNAYLHLVPHIDLMMRTDNDLFRLFKVCHRTCSDGTPPLTSNLIDLADRWQTSGLLESCRYTRPTGDELDAHRLRRTWFENFLRFREAPSIRLQTDNDSWLPADRWGNTQELHKTIFESVMESTKEPDSDMTEDDWRALWPFDTPY